MTDPFAFLQAEWPAVYEAADRAAANPDPRGVLLRTRAGAGGGMGYKSDASLRLPYQDNLSALIHEAGARRVHRPAIRRELPYYQGAVARVIHSGLAYAQSLIDDFLNLEELPHIDISVDMLDTGIDIPEG